MKAIILAAGQGKRMRSHLQKVLHPLLGKTIVQYAVEAALFAGIEDITVVVGSDGGEITAELSCVYPQLHFAIQEKPLGTGHAVQAGMGRINDCDDVLILCGDTPLITVEFIRELKNFYSKNNSDAVIAAAYYPELGDLGRVYADADGFFQEIVEYKDIKPGTPPTEWINTGIYVFKGGALKQGLAKMDNNNNQNEYYLTDVPKILREDGLNVRVFESRADMAVFTGINTQVQLAEAISHMRNRINTKHMLNGVRMIDPSTVYIDGTVEIEPGVVIYPGVILEGNCKISTDVIIGAHSHLKNATIGNGVHIQQSVLMDTVIGAGTSVGPFAYLRQGVQIGESCRIGNFVEIKNSNIGDGTKAAHLAYIGDADVGKNVNYGCGAITANYDGKNKHRTVIGDNAFIGSNSNLVAPVKIGEEVLVAAGSTITDDLQSGSLGIARAKQVEKLGWAKTKKS